jgi:hypothetical protein
MNLGQVHRAVDNAQNQRTSLVDTVDDKIIADGDNAHAAVELRTWRTGFGKVDDEPKYAMRRSIRSAALGLSRLIQRQIRSISGRT